jgi:CHAD domain
VSRAWPVEGIEPEATLAENARRILAVKIAELYSYAPAVPVEAASEALHDMRIAAKRLRYTLELFRAVFGEVGERQIERVKALQEELGTLHDLDVRIALVEEELARQAAVQAAAVSRELAGAEAEEHAAITAAALRPPPDDPRRGLIALLGRQHAARRERYRSFVALWERTNAEGMRGELVGLSATPVGSDGRDRGETPGTPG